jgi:cytoskeletal protein RodZ
MVSFTKKSLPPPKRVCVRLKELRQEKEMELSEMEHITKIEKSHLQALEECRFDLLPSGTIYQKNILKKYLKALGVEPDPFVKQLLNEEINDDQIKIIKKRPINWNLTNLSRLPTIFRYAGALILVFLLIFYLGLQVKRIVEPPRLTLLSPQDGHVIDQPTIQIQGLTEKEARVSVNGKEIRNNDNGQFSETIDLIPGLNTIVVTAEKKHGKRTSETRYVILRQS